MSETARGMPGGTPPASRSASPPGEEWWPAPTATGPLDAIVRLPGSKSLTNRYLVLAALADAPSRLRAPLRSRDTLLMAEAMRRLGAGVTDAPTDLAAVGTPDGVAGSGRGDAGSRDGSSGGGGGSRSPGGGSIARAPADWVVEPIPLHGDGTVADLTELHGATAVASEPTTASTSGEVVEVDCGLAGTVMRFAPPVAALTGLTVRFDGDPRLRDRPIAPLLGALRVLGARVTDDGRRFPATIHGRPPLPGGDVALDASASSQFVSGLLLVGARTEDGVTVRHVSPVGARMPSRPHVTMTVESLRDCGVVVDDGTPDVWRVDPGVVGALDVDIEPDLSNAGPFLAAALVAGGRVHVPGWPQHTTQAGDVLRDVLDAMGAEVRLGREGLTVTGTGELVGVDVDLGDAGEIAPTVAGLAALADTPSRLRGVGHLRGHESDRLAALAGELNALGGDVRPTDDGLEVRPRPLRGGRWDSHADHRMATTGAVVGLRVPGVLVADVATTSKTLPDFPGMWAALVGTQG